MEMVPASIKGKVQDQRQVLQNLLISPPQWLLRRKLGLQKEIKLLGREISVEKTKIDHALIQIKVQQQVLQQQFLRRTLQHLSP